VEGQALNQALHQVAAKTTRLAGGALKVIHVRLMTGTTTAQQVDKLDKDGKGSGDPSQTMQTVQDAQLSMPVALVVVVPTDNQFRSKCS